MGQGGGGAGGPPGARAAFPAAHPHGLRRRRPGGVPLRSHDPGRDRELRHAGHSRALSVRGARSPGGERREPGGAWGGGDDPGSRAQRRSPGARDRPLAERPAGAFPDVGERPPLRAPRRGGEDRAQPGALVTGPPGGARAGRRRPERGRGEALMYGRTHRIHFIGVGGVGMSGIAEVLLNMGYTVSGSDLKAGESTERLVRLGGRVFIGHVPSNVEGAQVVVFSTAVPKDNPELVAARGLGLPVISRAEMLGGLMRMKYGVAVGGSHGKTTTTSMIAAVLARGGNHRG